MLRVVVVKLTMEGKRQTGGLMWLNTIGSHRKRTSNTVMHCIKNRMNCATKIPFIYSVPSTNYIVCRHSATVCNTTCIVLGTCVRASL